MTERDSGLDSDKQPRLPFSETQRVYREGVESLIRPMLEEPQSEFSRKLEAGEAAFVDAGNDGGRGRLRRFIPIALPIDYQRQKLQPENVHNMAQIYLNGDYELDESLQDLANYYSVSKQAVNQGIQYAVKDVFPEDKINNITFELLTFAKPLSDAFKDRISAMRGGILLDIKRLVADEKADFKKLREAGFTHKQISRARQLLAKRQESTVIPRALKSWHDVLGVLNDPGIDRVVKRELILDIPIHIYQLYARQEGDRSPVFIDVSEVAKKARLDPSRRRGDAEFLAEYLKSRCIPTGYGEQVIHSGSQEGDIHRFRFILFADKGECVRLFEDAKGERFDRMRRVRV